MGKAKRKLADSGDDDLIPIDDAARIAGLSQSTIRRKLRDPNDDFPRPVELSARRRKFVRGEVKGWRAARMAARGKGRM